MARGKALHRHAFRRLAEDQRSWANDPRYRYGESWCGELSLYTEEERGNETRLDSDCPNCSAAMGKAMLSKYGDRVRLEPVDVKADKDYGLHYARSAYTFHLDGELRGYIISESGFGKGWRLRRLAGALDFRGSDPERKTGDCVSGEKPARYSQRGKPGEGADFRLVHYASRDAMACAAVKVADKGQLPTVAEQAALKADAAAKQQEEAAQRERDRAAWAVERERKAAQEAERREEAIAGLRSLVGRVDLSNVEAAGVASAAILLGIDLATP